MGIIAQTLPLVNPSFVGADRTRGGVVPAQGGGPLGSPPSLPQLAREAMGDWLSGYHWDWYATLTFRLKFSAASAWRAWNRWSAAHFPLGGWFAAMEFTERDGKQVPHLHALVNCSAEESVEDEFRAMLHDPHNSLAWKHWFKRYGRNSIDGFVAGRGAEGYCSKYVVKNAYDRGEYDVGGSWQSAGGR